MYRDDPRVLEQGRRLRLELEPLQRPRVHRRGQREHLQRDPSAERELLGLVDDPHAPASDLAEDPEVAQDSPLDARPREARPAPRTRLPAVDRPRSAISWSTGISRRIAPGVLRVPRRDVVEVDRLARLEPPRNLLRQLGQCRVQIDTREERSGAAERREARVSRFERTLGRERSDLRRPPAHLR